MSKLSLVLLLLSIIGASYCQSLWPNVQVDSCRPNTCCTWTDRTIENTTDAQYPKGFALSVVPESDLQLPGPCVIVNGLGDIPYIEFAAEVQDPTANNIICIEVAGSNPTCASRQVKYCKEVASASMTFTINCGTSCDSSSFNFFYRVTLSPTDVNDDDNWCANQEVQYPSSLIQIIPPETVTVQSTVADGGAQVYYSFFLLLVGIMIALVGLF